MTGVTGFIVHDEADGRGRVDRLGELDRTRGPRGSSTAASPRGAWPKTTSTSTKSFAWSAHRALRAVIG